MEQPLIPPVIDRNRARLRAKPVAERRVAIILTDDGGIPDALRAAMTLLRALDAAGYRVAGLPDDVADLTKRMAAGPSLARPQASAEETLSFAEYSLVLASLPMAMQQAVSRRWGLGESDPFFRPGRLDCGRFGIPALRCGNVAVVLLPLAPNDDAVPPHGFLAACAWISDGFRADAVIDPGGAAACSFAGAIVAPLLHLDPTTLAER
ncbi:MAG TPA: cobaltochelatase subunit CobN [Stellaceae bacterium]|jgi:cobaltochelatase CobN|nr:cobaltochelatase subunit CobN [Stellaceae bacterium]